MVPSKKNILSGGRHLILVSYKKLKLVDNLAAAFIFTWFFLQRNFVFIGCQSRIKKFANIEPINDWYV